MSKTITYIKVQRRMECKLCKGTGEEVLPENASTSDRIIVYECSKCRGKGFTMHRKTISLDQFKKLPN